MEILMIINNAPYGSEKVYNALRLAIALQNEHDNVKIRIFLLADSVTCAIPNQITPQGYYNLERMLKFIIHKGGEIKTCGSCITARGMKDIKLIDGVEISTIGHLAQWAVESDKVLTF